MTRCGNGSVGESGFRIGGEERLKNPRRFYCCIFSDIQSSRAVCGSVSTQTKNVSADRLDGGKGG